MGEAEARETLGMTEEELQAYFEELLEEQAAEVVEEEEDQSLAQVMASPGFAAARSAMSYAVQLIAANNAYLTRHLLDLGLLPQAPAADVDAGGEDEDERG